MFCFRFTVLFVSVLAIFCDGVRVNMQGSLSLGKDVVDTISYYFVRRNNLGGRRSYTHGNEESSTDTIALIVNSAFLCRDLKFCQGDTSVFVNGYITALANTIEILFESLVQGGKEQEENNTKVVIFEEELRLIIEDIRRLLRNTNEQITSELEIFTWIDTLKKINAKFQARSITFASQRLEGNAYDINEVKKKLTQRLIIGLTLVELKFEQKLCLEHNICAKSYECTKSLNAVLELIETVSAERAKEFVRYFYEALLETGFYQKISDVTANEFQSILNDMAYAENIPTKDVLATVRKSVQDRLSAATEHIDKGNGRDVKLLHVILSDMDHFYSKQTREPFKDFLSTLFEWTQKGGRFLVPLRRLMKDIKNMLTYDSEELIVKLTDEVKVFMEITVDPEK